MSFPEARIGDLLVFQRGFDITKDQQTPGNVPVVSSSGISSFHGEPKATGPGVVIGRKGSLGTVHFVETDFWPHDTTLWIKDFKGSCPRFLAYFLKTLRLENFDSGSSNPTLNRNHLHKIKVRCPGREAQRKIAAILAAYDDLIANNQRRIALLESMAEEIYREWFARMRYPGQKRCGLSLPEGWNLVPSTELLNVLGGGTPNTDNSAYWDGDIPFFTPRDAGTSSYVIDTDLHLTEKGLENCSSSLFPEGTIFITARGTVGKVVMAGAPMAMNQSCYALRPREEQLPYFSFLALKVAADQIRGVSKSGVFDNIVMDTFRVVQLVDPGVSCRSRFNELAKPIFESIHSLLHCNRRLTEARDALLPRLISGKLRVDHLDIQFPPSMQDLA